MRTDRARASLVAKGFQERDRDHFCFFYYHHGKKTAIHTKFSHGSQIGEYQLGRMRRQLFLPNLEHLGRLLSCDMDADEYRELLIRQQII